MLFTKWSSWRLYMSSFFAALKHDFRTGVFDDTYTLLVHSVCVLQFLVLVPPFLQTTSCNSKKGFNAPITRRRVPKWQLGITCHHYFIQNKIYCINVFYLFFHCKNVKPLWENLGCYLSFLWCIFLFTKKILPRA